MTVPEKNALVAYIGGVVTIALAGLTAVLAFSAWPSPESFGYDKLLHFLAFTAMALPLSFAHPKHIYYIVLGAIAYGGLIEVVQSMIGRDASWFDLLADAIGASTGAAFGVWIEALFRSSK